MIHKIGFEGVYTVFDHFLSPLFSFSYCNLFYFFPSSLSSDQEFSKIKVRIWISNPVIYLIVGGLLMPAHALVLGDGLDQRRVLVQHLLHAGRVRT